MTHPAFRPGCGIILTWMSTIAASIPSFSARRIRWRALRYTLTFLGPALAVLGFFSHGWLAWSMVIYGFVAIPLLELLLPPRHLNLSPEEEAAALQDPLHDLMLYAIVPVQWALLVLFLFRIQEAGLTAWEVAGRTVTMGLMCGVYGINVAHELGHRAKAWERDLARLLLLSSLYMHFIIEHNRGHHRGWQRRMIRPRRDMVR